MTTKLPGSTFYISGQDILGSLNIVSKSPNQLSQDGSTSGGIFSEVTKEYYHNNFSAGSKIFRPKKKSHPYRSILKCANILFNKEYPLLLVEISQKQNSKESDSCPKKLKSEAGLLNSKLPSLIRVFYRTLQRLHHQKQSSEKNSDKLYKMLINMNSNRLCN